MCAQPRRRRGGLIEPHLVDRSGEACAAFAAAGWLSKDVLGEPGALDGVRGGTAAELVGRCCLLEGMWLEKVKGLAGGAPDAATVSHGNAGGSCSSATMVNSEQQTFNRPPKQHQQQIPTRWHTEPAPKGKEAAEGGPQGGLGVVLTYPQSGRSHQRRVSTGVAAGSAAPGLSRRWAAAQAGGRSARGPF